MAKRDKSGNVHKVDFEENTHTDEVTKEGGRLKGKKRWRRVIIMLSVILAITMAIFVIVGFISSSGKRNNINLDYGSVSVQPLKGEKYSTESDYSAIDVFARLNWTFAHQEKWYSEMHGKVDTVIKQDVSTYKKFNNGILISADLTSSSLINNANEFCYLPDQDIVMWRKAAGGASTYDGFDTPWQQGDPYRTMTIGGKDGFKATNGLPAYEFSVYVIEEQTVESATPIERTEDGLFTVTFTLSPDTWEEEDEGGNLITKGATAYYENQMIFSGGLPEAPSFHSISYTVLFDEDWLVHRTDITENYDAKYGPIAANCIYNATTVYEYNTEKAESTDFEDYFQNYVNVPINNKAPAKREPTAAECLAEAFGQVLTAPTTLDLDATLDGENYKGVINLDLSKADLTSEIDLTKIAAKLKVGSLYAWLEGGEAYLNYGGAKLKVGINDLIDLLGEYLKDESEGESDLLGALGGGEFKFDETSAYLHSVLPLGSFSLPVDFYFLLEEDGVKLDRVEADLPIEESDMHLVLRYGTEELKSLSEGEREEYAPLIPYARRLISLFSAETLRANISYQKDDISLAGDILVTLEPISLKGSLDISYGNIRKKADIAYKDGTVYLDLEGIKLSAEVVQALKLVNNYVELPKMGSMELNIADVIKNVLSEEFANLIKTTKGEDRLTVSLRGSELLKTFGVNFDLGDVKIEVSNEGLAANALNIDALLSEGESFEIQTDGYTPIVSYANSLISLFSNENVSIQAVYGEEGSEFGVQADILLNTKNLSATSEIVLRYKGIQKTVRLLYAEDVVYLSTDELKVSANIDELTQLLSEYIELPETDVDARALIEKVLSIDLGRVLQISEQGDTLNVALNGTLLLQELGVNFELGQVNLAVGKGSLKASALGANIEIKKGKAFELDTSGYIEIVGYARYIQDLLSTGYLTANVDYTTDNLSVKGTIELSLESLQAMANLTLKYGEIEKTVDLIYLNGDVYVSVEGLRLKANIQDALDFIGGIVELPENDFESEGLLEKVLGMNFGELLTLKEAEGTLEATVQGTKLLKVLGLNFDLGEVKVELSEESLKASVLGANIEIKKGEAFELDTNGYIEIVGYAKNLTELLTSETLKAKVNYNAGEFVLQAEIDLRLKELIAKAQVKVTYQDVTKELSLIYADGDVYAAVDGLKIKLNVAKVAALFELDEKLQESNEIDVQKAIESLLAIDLRELLTLTEKDCTLNLLLDGSAVLKNFGIDFELGNVELILSENGLTLHALGADVEVEKGTDFDISDEDKEGYVELSDELGYLKEMLESDNYRLQVVYNTADISIEGDVDLSLRGLKEALENRAQDDDIVSLLLHNIEARGALTLKSGEAERPVGILLKDGVVYIDIDTIRASIKIEEVLSLLPREETAQNEVNGEEIIKKVLSLHFGDFVALEREDALKLTLRIEPLLKEFGTQISMGDIAVEIFDGKLQLSVDSLAANVEIGKEFEIEASETEGYAELSPYLKSLKELVSKDFFEVEVNYGNEGDEFTLSGNVYFDMREIKSLLVKKEADVSSLLSSLKARAVVTVNYQGYQKTAELSYVGKDVFLTIDDLKVKTDLSSAVEALVLKLSPSEGEKDYSALIEKLLSIPYGNLFALSVQTDAEGAERLSLLIRGTELLEEFGKTLAVGDVHLAMQGEEIFVEALGAKIALRGCEEFEVDTQNFHDLTTAAQKIVSIVKTQKVDFSGEFNLTFEENEVSLNVQDAFLSWEENSISLELKGTVAMFGAGQSFRMRVTEGANGYIIKLALENLGVEVNTEELSTLSDAFASLKARIDEVATKIVGEGNLPHLADIPKMETLAALSSGALGGETVLDVLGTLLGDFSIRDLLDGISFGKKENENSLITLTYQGLTLELCDETEEGLLVANISYVKDAVSVSAVLHANSTTREMPQEEETGLCFLEVAHFAAVLRELEGALGILEETDLDYDVLGSIVTDGVERYNVTGKISYVLNGAEVPFTLNGTNVEVSSGLNLAIQLDVVAKGTDETGAEKDTSVYLDFFLLDMDTSGAQNGELDFYVSASTVGRPQAGETIDGYDPIKLYAPSTEIMTVLSGALSVFGMDDIDLLNKYFISQYLPEQRSVDEFHALGESLLSTLTQSLGEKIAPLKDVLQKLGAFSEKVESEQANAISVASIMPAQRGYIRSVIANENDFKIVLNSDVLYNMSGLEDMAFSLARREGNFGFVLSELAVENIYNGAGNERTSLSIKHTQEGLADMQPSDPQNYTSFAGVDKLLVALANSATHEESGKYAVNNNFYIDGSAAVNLNIAQLNLMEIKIDKINVSVDLDEERKVAVKVHLEYQGFEKAIIGVVLGERVLINGDTVFDLTIKDDMVYMRRVQKSCYDKGFLSCQERTYSEAECPILYRTMPLNTFTGDLVNQLKFIFNISDTDFAKIMSMASGNGNTGDATTLDVGAQLDKYISNFQYQNNGADSWILSLSGEGLTGSSAFSDIVLTLGAGDDHLIRSLGAGMNIAKLININAGLTWRNPAGQMDAGTVDGTVNLEPEVKGGMQKNLDEKTSWAVGDMIEGQGATISYLFDSKVLDTQKVIYDQTTKELLGYLNYPDVKDIKPGYIGSWKETQTLPEGNELSVILTPREYSLVFQSKREAEGFTYNEEQDVWENTIPWTYSEVKNPDYPLMKDEVMQMTGYTCPAGKLHTAGDKEWHVFDSDTIIFVAEWEMIAYTATFYRDGEILEVVTGYYGDVITYPTAPEIEGYTFESWSEHPEKFYGNYSITAKYIPKLYTVTFESDSKVPEWELKNGKYTYVAEMYFDSEIVIDAGEYNRKETVKGDMTVTLPSSDEIKSGSLPGEWKALEYTIDKTNHTSSAKLTAEYTSRIIIYHSEVECTISDCVQDQEILFKTDYTLKNPSNVNGYVFLGWYTKDESGTWYQVTDLKYDSCDVVTKVEALWYQSASVSLSVSKSRSGGFLSYKYTYTMDASVSGGKLIGALAEEADVNYTFKFTLKKTIGTADLGTDTKNESSDHFTSEQIRDNGSSVTVQVTVTYSYNGQEVQSETVSASAGC